MSYYLNAFQNCANFNGRASRKQYWMFVLFNIIVSFVVSLVAEFILGDLSGIIDTVYRLVILVPSLAICVRRMHDIGKSWAWILISLIPIIGQIWFIVLCCKQSQEGENQFGAMPV